MTPQNPTSLEQTAKAILVALACSNPQCACQRSAVRGAGRTHCPVHSDPGPSLNVEVRGDKVLWKCHAGCAQDAVTAALRDRRLLPEPVRGLTLDDLASAKRLSRTFLESVSVSEVIVHGKPRVRIDYADERGQLQAVRYRVEPGWRVLELSHGR